MRSTFGKTCYLQPHMLLRLLIHMVVNTVFNLKFELIILCTSKKKIPLFAELLLSGFFLTVTGAPGHCSSCCENMLWYTIRSINNEPTYVIQPVHFIQSH